MRRIAAPMVGGLVTSTILTLIVIPALYALVMQRRVAPSTRGAGTAAAPSA
jgi:Cu(I)/Ag(I) efflux system membrane protein CusA/SilA